nr:ribonuclease H-like domain-containing protein [Tanacetum cinerariifolium]
MSRDVLTVGSTMRIPLLYRGEYSQWVERFMNYLKEQTIGEEMINSIKNGDQPLPRVTQVSNAGSTSTEQPPLKDKSMCNKTAKDLCDALARHMLGSEYGKQDRKAVVLYEYEMFKATEGELLLDTYIRYLHVINALKKCGYSKDNCELNFKFLNNLQPEWKQYAIMMRQNKNLMDINIDALYNILKQNQIDVNDAMGSKKKTVVVTSDPLALIAEKTNVSRSKEKVVLSSDSEGSEADDFNDKKVEKKADEKKRDMSKVKCYNCKKEGHFAKDCKKSKEASSSSVDEKISENRNGPVSITTDTNGMIKDLPPKTAKEVMAREMERKARTILLMALPEDHLAKFHKMVDAKEMWEAIKSSNSGSDNEVKSCTKTCEESYARLKKLYDEQRDKLGDASLEIIAYTLALKKESDIENTSVNDRYAAGMHAILPPMTENYMPSRPDVEIDYSKFTYGPKQTSVDESYSKSSEYASCESDSSVETTTSMPAPVENAPKDKGIINSGCSRHMTGNKAHLDDYQEFKGGSVAFGGSNGRITGKGKIKAGRLDFKDVYYVEELKHYNLFSMSQMCDKKNNVLSTNTDCLVLSHDIKLLNENKVCLKVPKQHKCTISISRTLNRLEI